MNQEQATVMLGCLCCWFEVPVPELRWSNRSKRGRYYASKRRKRGTYLKRAIACGPKCWRGPVNSLIHEFAHYLQHARGRFMVYAVGDHGPAFHRALTDATEAWYGDASMYDWGTEYKRLSVAGPL